MRYRWLGTIVSWYMKTRLGRRHVAHVMRQLSQDEVAEISRRQAKRMWGATEAQADALDTRMKWMHHRANTEG